MLSFAEKRQTQRIIVEQNKLLAGNPSFAEKRAAQKIKLEAMTKLGMVGKQPSSSETTEITGSGGDTDLQPGNDQAIEIDEEFSVDDEKYARSPSGSLNFGEITTEMTGDSRRSAGRIRLENGYYDSGNIIGSGLAYISALRESELRSTGMTTVEKFVQFVVDTVSEVRAIPGSRSLLLSAQNGDGRAMMITVDKSDDSPYYLVKDAEAPKAGLGKREKWKLLWQKPAGEQSYADDLDPNSPNYRYKDTGNIAGNRKELASLMIRNAAKSGQRLRATDIDWEEIDQNPREAKELITKSNLFGSVDWAGLRAEGMEPSAGFLIDRVYAAIGKEPSEDSPGARRDYAIGLETLRDRLESCKTPDQVTKVIDELREETEGVTLNSEETSVYGELQKESDAIFEVIRAYDQEKDRLWSAYREFDFKHSSLKYEQEKRINRRWRPDPELDKQIAELLPLKEAAHQAFIDFVDANPDFKDKKVELGNGGIMFANKYDMERRALREKMDEIVSGARIRNRMENPLHRAWVIMGDRFIKVLFYRSYKGSDAFKEHVATAKAGKISDWSWAEKETAERKKTSTKESQRFQLIVADKFERVGGRTIMVDSTSALKDQFGLREVQSGNWVLRDVNSAKFHTEQTAGAFSDLADIMGVPDNMVSMNGKLAMAFGSRGKGNAGFGGAARAHYEPVQRVINLTKMNGGGALGHEWFHALDNLLSEAMTNEPSSSENYITEGANLPDSALKNAVSELKSALTTGIFRLPVKFAYTDKDYRTAKYNFDREIRNPNSIQGRIKSAGNASDAVIAVVNVYGDDALYKKRSNGYDWAKLAAAYYDNNPAGGSVVVNAGRPTSSFERESVRLDGGVSEKYWSQPKEMAARAFQSFLEDKLESLGRRNDYLSSMADNKYYKNGLFGPVYPFPEGEERTIINAAFDKLIAAMREDNAFVALDAVFAKMPVS
jgi:hypothetical protein